MGFTWDLKEGPGFQTTEPSVQVKLLLALCQSRLRWSLLECVFLGRNFVKF